MIKRIVASRHAIFVVLLILGWAVGGYAETPSSTPPPGYESQLSLLSDGSGAATGREYTRGQVLFLGGAGYGSFIAADLLSNLVPPPVGPIAGFGTGVLGLAPLWFVDLPAGAVTTAATGLAMGAGFLATSLPDIYGDGNYALANDAITIGSHLGMWSSYRAYALARVHTKESGYSEQYQNYSFGELFAAPYGPEQLSRLSFWAPLAGYTLGSVGLDLAATGGANSVFRTGVSYIGATKIPILVGLLSTAVLSALTYDFVAIGEEGLSRDLEYKELQITLGRVPASIINAITFPAIHVPQEIQAGYSAGQMLIDFAYRAAATVGLQWAYNDGGLPNAVAAHMWMDTAASLVDFLLLSGTPGVLSVQMSLRL